MLCPSFSPTLFPTFIFSSSIRGATSWGCHDINVFPHPDLCPEIKQPLLFQILQTLSILLIVDLHPENLVARIVHLVHGKAKAGKTQNEKARKTLHLEQISEHSLETPC